MYRICSRGPVVIFTCDPRESEWFWFADYFSKIWLDAFEVEPYEGLLTGYPQVILTPHVGSYTLECRKQMESEAVENLIAALLEGAE